MNILYCDGGIFAIRAGAENNGRANEISLFVGLNDGVFIGTDFEATTREINNQVINS